MISYTLKLWGYGCFAVVIDKGKNMELNKRYIIDLSQAQTPADIVFELCNIMEKSDASNQDIWLKLGEVALNQSQILSIISLMSSINSKIVLIESQAEQTNLAASALGISTKAVEEEIENELIANTPEAPVNTENELPTQQYVPMVDHIDCEPIVVENSETVVEDSVDTEEISNTAEEAESALENALFDDNENDEQENVEVDAQDVSQPDEAIQEHLDSIFDSEVKLENILNEDKTLNEMKNWPLTKEAEEFEIPEEEMTDEDYAILQMSTQYHKQTVRSGQVIKSNGNVVIIGDCHPGCEIYAAGDITVWGVLGGVAHAGYKGNTKAKIRALNLNAIQLRIAESFARRPDHIKNNYVEKTNTFTPEEARNINGSIVILKIND